MSLFRMKLPDVGEGVAEAEIVSWLVVVGDRVTPDTVLGEVLTDKATVEVSSPVSGTVVSLHGEPGDILAVGGDYVGIETGDGAPRDVAEQPAEGAADSVGDDAHSAADADDAARPDDGDEVGFVGSDEPAEPPAVSEPVAAPATANTSEVPTPAPTRPSSGSVLASPAVRARARNLDVDLSAVRGTGPGGRVEHTDLDRLLAGSRGRFAGGHRSSEPNEVPVRGVRRQISRRLAAAWREIPHITYVESVDVTELEAVRAELNRDTGATRLTILPFLVRAIVVACSDQPEINAHYDGSAEVLSVFPAVHVGIATQTDDGLVVPVVRDADIRGLRDIAGEIRRLSDAARAGAASREELSGSTISVTSLGAMGGVATTPIINAPEVAIVGVNKIETRPVWSSGGFVPRQMLNLSCSFDHRMVDGWDAATFVQRIKSLLERPALLFVDD